MSGNRRIAVGGGPPPFCVANPPAGRPNVVFQE